MGNIRTTLLINEKKINFDSKFEAEHYKELLVRERAGQIKDLKLQPSFVVIPEQFHDGKKLSKKIYKGDFQYIENGRTVVVDTKGFKTEVYEIKKRLFLKEFPDIIFKEVFKEVRRATR
ncbi:DUF1064 domain-containing protein [Poseidonibacter ostreae]|uniref:DUF1064 domain-containing protein n=2 Tax=Poseidonibacter ostreae TaxID=2654171 RepID=A0A6L4WXG5_9BACT|nr:DUF1064 domain-containing protein [Poseidonibacter ostreae]